MTEKRPTESELVRLKDNPRHDDLRAANRPIDRILDLFR